MLEHDLERAEDIGDSTTAKLKTAEVEISRLTEGSSVFWKLGLIWFLVLRTFEASGEQAEKNEIEMEDKIAALTRESDENSRLLEQTQSENSNLKKLLEEMERDFDKMKMERDEAKQELQSMMQEIGDIA